MKNTLPNQKMRLIKVALVPNLKCLKKSIDKALLARICNPKYKIKPEKIKKLSI